MQVLVLAFLAQKPNPNLGQENPDLDIRNPLLTHLSYLQSLGKENPKPQEP